MTNTAKPLDIVKLKAGHQIAVFRSDERAWFWTVGEKASRSSWAT